MTFTKDQLDKMTRDAHDAHESCERCDVCFHVLALAAEVERLQAIVDRLPKTGDGVPVIPGQKVWHCANRHYGPHAGVLFPSEGIIARMPKPYCLGEHCYSEGIQGDDGGGVIREWEECYSTREAAEAAGSESNASPTA